AAAVAAAIVGAVGLGLPFQLAAFAVAAGAGLGVVRPLAVRHVRQPPLLRTGTSALVGKSATVTEEVTALGGRVRIGGEVWSARSYEESQVTDPRAADYEIVNYIQAIEQLTATMLRSVIGSMDLEQTLTSRDHINNMLRGVLDEASGKWGIRVTRVEIKAIDPPKSVVDAMEKQMRAEREKRAAILTAEGVRQSKILTAEGEKQSAILTAEGAKQSAILRAEGQAQAIGTVFQAVHLNDADPKVLAYQYLQTLPQLAQAEGNTFWVIPSEVTSALRTLSGAFGGEGDGQPAGPGHPGHPGQVTGAATAALAGGTALPG